MNRRTSLSAVLALVLAFTGARPLPAQQLRFRSITTGRYVQLRPLAYDSATGTYVALPVTYSAPITEDLEVSAWGLGVPGLRAYGLMRGRTAAGSGVIWPRYDDHFDLMVAYLELERTQYRVRAGRQHRASGLGWYAFDGVTGTWRPKATVRAEVYGGRGYSRGFLEPVSGSSLQSLDPLRPDEDSWLVGASVWAAPTPRSSVTAVYQRQALMNDAGLVSERAAIDGQVGVGSRLDLSAAVDADIARAELGRARLGAMVRLQRRLHVGLEVYRYMPILDLTTIWGVFSPESHQGITGSVRYGPVRGVSLNGAYTYRRYQPMTNTTPFLPEAGDDENEFSAGARVTSRDWVVDGTYRLLDGFGGYQSGGALSVAHAPTFGPRVGLRAVAFQRDEMFRVSGGTVYGLGADVGWRFSNRLSIRGDLTRYEHQKGKGQVSTDWSQTRGMVVVDWTFGANPDRIGAGR